MTSLPPSFKRLLEKGPEGAVEFLQNVRPISVGREPEEISLEILESVCWLWQGFASPEGYGVDFAQGKDLVHRTAYKLFIGPIPDGKRVEQDCGSRLCVNPKHLRLATGAETAKRTGSGTGGAGFKVSAEQREEVRNALAAGEQQSAIALRFGISQPQVSLIKNNKAWKEQPETASSPADPEQSHEAESHTPLSLSAWLNLQMRRLGPVGQLARGEALPDSQREKALGRATKEYMTYQLLSREYETRRRENR